MQDDKLDQLLTQVTTIATEMKGFSAMLLEHDRDINGNSQPGIKRDLDRLKQIEKRRERWHWIMVGAIVVNTLGIFAWVIKDYLTGG